MTIRAALLGICVALAAGCGESGSGDAGAGLMDAGAGSGAAGDWFVDGAADSGLDFVHFNGASGEFYYPEILPPGVGLLDYDNDGDLDVYLVQGRALGQGATAGGAPAPPHGALPLRGRLYRNDLEVAADGSRTLRFADVTAGSGIDADGFGLGVAAGDVNNDGWTDLLLTNFGPASLYLNQGDGTFRDASDAGGIDGAPGFGVSASFADFDRDGWLDLYVGHNVNYALDNTIECSNVTGASDYCPPETYGGTPDHLYRNTGDGRFVDVSDSALVGGQFGPALGVAVADYDGDGWIDIYVANDATENLLWINQQDGTFRDVALLAGAALSGMGLAEASMGVDAGDYDNDGDEDLFMTHITNEGNNLYVNDGTASFRDRSTVSGLGAGSLPYTGWGTTWFDYDNDGWLDLLAVNGTVIASPGPADRPFPYDQRKSLFRNLGDGTFEDVTGAAGAAFELSETGRGAAFGDVDNDGDVDVVVGNDTGPARLLINRVGNRRHWIGLRLAGAGGRDMLGARVAVRRPGEPTLWRRARSDGSYASANDPRVVVGLGDSDGRPAVEVHWPDGRTETWEDVEVDRWTTLEQGTGSS
ncbi:MAG: CRTAC1 family protein [Acidobacteria bacterium]|nr:CRTAC1 family protein [Acidobacteriota bacterium]